MAFAAPAPKWYLQEIARLTADGGRREAENAAHRSDDEPYESYVTEWTSSFDGITLRGRLYGQWLRQCEYTWHRKVPTNE